MTNDSLLVNDPEDGIHSETSSLRDSLQGDGYSTLAATSPKGSDADATAAGEHKWPASGASFNLLNTMVGAGIIGLPYAVRQAGFEAGLVLMFAVAVLTVYTAWLLIELGVKTKAHSYEDVACRAFGSAGFYALSTFALIFDYGALVSYFVMVGDTVPVVAGVWWPDSFIADRQICVVLVGLFVVLPLCMLKHMRSLARFSVFSMAVSMLIVVIVLARGFQPEYYHRPNATLPSSHSSLSVFAGIGTMSFAFVCHDGIFVIFQSLPKPRRTMATWRVVSASAIMGAWAISGTFAALGYNIFGDGVKGNILNNFDDDDDQINAARGLLGVTMAFTLPMSQFIGRTYVHALLFRRLRGVMTNTQHWTITLALTLSALALGTFVDKLDLVLELTGSVSATVVGYVFPVLCCFRIYGAAHFMQDWAHRAKALVLAVVLVFGLAAFFLGTYTTIEGAINPSDA